MLDNTRDQMLKEQLLPIIEDLVIQEKKEKKREKEKKEKWLEAFQVHRDLMNKDLIDNFLREEKIKEESQHYAKILKDLFGQIQTNLLLPIRTSVTEIVEKEEKYVNNSVEQLFGTPKKLNSFGQEFFAELGHKDSTEKEKQRILEQVKKNIILVDPDGTDRAKLVTILKGDSSLEEVTLNTHEEQTNALLKLIDPTIDQPLPGISKAKQIQDQHKKEQQIEHQIEKKAQAGTELKILATVIMAFLPPEPEFGDNLKPSHVRKIANKKITLEGQNGSFGELMAQNKIEVHKKIQETISAKIHEFIKKYQLHLSKNMPDAYQLLHEELNKLKHANEINLAECLDGITKKIHAIQEQISPIVSSTATAIEMQEALKEIEQMVSKNHKYDQEIDQQKSTFKIEI